VRSLNRVYEHDFYPFLSSSEKCLLPQAWWHTSVIPALGRPKQEDCEFEVSLGYIVSETLSQKKKKLY
jgi:hypothetical protein